MLKDQDKILMKVAIVTDWECNSGIYTYSRYLINELSKKIHVEIIPIKYPHLFDLIYFSPQNFSLHSILWLLKILRKIYSWKKYFDVINLQEPIWAFAPLIYLSLLFGERKAKIVTTIHETYLKGEKKSIVLRIHRRIVELFIAKFSDKIVVLAEHARDIMESKGIPREKICVIPHGSYQSPVFLDREVCKARLGVVGKRVITIFGFIRPTKGYHKILKILPYLGENTILLVAGGLPNPHSKEQEECFQLLKQAESSGKVKITGYIKEADISVVMNATDIMLFPYTRAVQSGVLSIALAYRIPTITSDLPYFRILKERYNCIEIARDEFEFLEKIKALFTDEDLRNKLVTNSQKYWSENNWEKVADKYVEVFKRVIEYDKVQS